VPSTVDSTLNNTKPSAKPMRVQPNKVVATSPISVAASAIWEISIGDNAAVATDLRDFCWTMFLLLFKCVPKGTNMKKRECKVGQIFSQFRLEWRARSNSRRPTLALRTEKITSRKAKTRGTKTKNLNRAQNAQKDTKKKKPRTRRPGRRRRTWRTTQPWRICFFIAKR